MTKLNNMDPFENPVVEFDFSAELDAVDSAVVSVRIINGRDIAAASVLSGAVQVLGAKATQRVNGGVDGVDYELRCEAVRGTTKRVLTGVLPVRRA